MHSDDSLLGQGILKEDSNVGFETIIPIREHDYDFITGIDGDSFMIKDKHLSEEGDCALHTPISCSEQEYDTNSGINFDSIISNDILMAGESNSCSQALISYNEPDCDVTSDINKEESVDWPGVDLDLDDIFIFEISERSFCTTCDEEFINLDLLNEHMIIHDDKYICEQCGTDFKKLDLLENHSLTHLSKTFLCLVCSLALPSEDERNKHFRANHKNIVIHKCPFCPEIFRNYIYRDKHALRKHGVKYKGFPCFHCTKSYASNAKLKAHTHSIHSEEKRFSCKVCNQKFHFQYNLNDHMIKHLGARSYQCFVCKKYFARKRAVARHMKKHDNET